MSSVSDWTLNQLEDKVVLCGMVIRATPLTTINCYSTQDHGQLFGDYIPVFSPLRQVKKNVVMCIVCCLCFVYGWLTLETYVERYFCYFCFFIGTIHLLVFVYVCSIICLKQTNAIANCDRTYASCIVVLKGVKNYFVERWCSNFDLNMWVTNM